MPESRFSNCTSRPAPGHDKSYRATGPANWIDRTSEAASAAGKAHRFSPLTGQGFAVLRETAPVARTPEGGPRTLHGQTRQIPYQVSPTQRVAVYVAPERLHPALCLGGGQQPGLRPALSYPPVKLLSPQNTASLTETCLCRQSTGFLQSDSTPQIFPFDVRHGSAYEGPSVCGNWCLQGYWPWHCLTALQSRRHSVHHRAPS